ncbi:MAG: glycerol-3-phosphate acyltransferase [Candidatus Krumholzibacteria bacterium]|nr:glycerol-3-phosphate acyltransferase [Candidatus Krumholzibacteria bacterium]
MNFLIAASASVGGYLLGSLSPARAVTALFGRGARVPRETIVGIEGTDRHITMRTVSATSVSRNVGPRFGFLTYVLDVLKVFVPVLVLKRLWPDGHYHLMAATTGVAGHIWPLYHRFRGGRGVSAIYGGVFAIDWIGVFINAFAGMILGFFVLRDVYLSYIAGLWILVPWLWWRTGDPWTGLYAAVVASLCVISSIPEAREYYRARREDPVWADPAQAWRLSAMGRGIIRAATRFGLVKPRPRGENGDATGGPPSRS